MRVSLSVMLSIHTQHPHGVTKCDAVPGTGESERGGCVWRFGSGRARASLFGRAKNTAGRFDMGVLRLKEVLPTVLISEPVDVE